VLTRLDEVDGSVERELHACQVELVTGVCRSTGEAVHALRAMRRAVKATGAGLLASGTHPSAIEGEAEIDRQGALRAHPVPARTTPRRRP